MKKKILIIILSLFFIINLTSCFSIRSKGNKSRETYSVFYIDNGVLQYFVKPLEFKSKGYTLHIDFTFRDTTQYQNQITANYTLYSKEPIKNIESIVIKTDTNSFQIIGNEKLYINKNKDGYQIRYSGLITYKQLTDFFYCKKLVIHIFLKDEKVFKPIARTSKMINIVREEVIDIIELNKEEN